MKIAYIAASAIPSSTANSVQVMKVCQALTQNGETVQLYVPGKNRTAWEALHAHYGVQTEFKITWVPSYPALKRLDFITRSLLTARSAGVDLIYTRLLWAAIGALMLRMTVILEIHDLPVGRFGPWLYRVYCQSKRTRLTVYITRALKNLVEKACDCAPIEADFIISPDGVDLERYEDLPVAPKARKVLGLDEGFTAVYSGGFYEGRGLETLFNLARFFPQVQFVWVGGNTGVVDQWKARINEAGIENVRLTGFVANEKLPVYQAAADILLMPYSKTISGSSGGNIAEVCSPMKMFEYMAAGRTILTSDIPVLREVLNEGNAAFYVPEDMQDLRLRFDQLLGDNKLCQRLAMQAKLDVKDYSWRKRMRRIIDRIKD